jgi:hypothetical protein
MINRMPAVTIRSLGEYMSYLGEHCGHRDLLFRGQGTDRSLLPRIARLRRRASADPQQQEALMFGDFRRQVIPYLEFQPQDEWDWLALAQHHGLATRLLDWTTNPLAALWFAVGSPPRDMEHGVVWVLEYDAERTEPHRYFDTPFEMDYPPPDWEGRVWIVQPRTITRRIGAQSGWFTAHPFLKSRGNWSALDEDPGHRDLLTKIQLPAETFQTIRRDLARCGVNAASIYPDIDGLCKHIEWLHSLLTDESDTTIEPVPPAPPTQPVESSN